MASRIIKSYFNFSNETNIARSKRMRDLLRRLSSKRLFVSKVEIKHNNDKYSLNLYVYNTAKRFLLRKIYMFNRNKFLYKEWKKNKYTSGVLFKKYLSSKKLTKSFKKSRSFFKKSRSYFNVYMNNQLNYYLFKFKNLNKLANIFFHKLLLKKSIDKTTLNTDTLNMTTLIKRDMRLKDKNKLLHLIQRCYRIYYAIFMSRLNKEKLRRKNTLTKTLYIRFIINQFKFNKYLPKLKMLLENIFNKKVDLNIVDLKYLHLNSETFIDSLLLKSKKRLSTAYVFKRSLNLVKTPQSFVEAEAISLLPELYQYKNFDVNHLHNLDRAYTNFPYHNKIKNIDKQDLLNKFLLSMYTYPLHYQGKLLLFSRNNKHTSIVNTIKHKWLSGVRLEAAGRLTRRFTASRSISLLEYKGNLKYVKYNKELDMKNNLSVVLLRNTSKANCQYTLGNSKRRIGAFGIKGWISSK